MKPLVIYHADCTDGFGAAFAAWLKLGDEAEYRPCQYGQDFDFYIKGAMEGRDVYILDFSFPRELMDWAFVNAKRVVWLDHHKTAFEMYGVPIDTVTSERTPMRDVELNDSKSGALLAWEYFHPAKQITNNQSTLPWAIRFNGYAHDSSCSPAFMEDETLYTKEGAEREADKMNASAIKDGYLPMPGQTRIYEASFAPEGYGEEFSEVPRLIRHIDDRDRWQFKLNGSKEIHAALGSMKPWSFEQWKYLILEVLYREGTAILRAQDQHVASMAKQARKCCIFGTAPRPGLPAPWVGTDQRTNEADYEARGLACNATLHMSELGHVLATQSGTYGLIYYIGADNKVKCSLRSNGDYDVSAIAKAFGGGGHRNAAGFETNIDTLMGWLK